MATMGKVETIYEAIRMHDGMHKREICDMTGYDPNEVGRIADFLRRNRLVRVTGARLNSRWFPTKKDQSLPEQFKSWDTQPGRASTYTAKLSSGQRARHRFEQALIELNDAQMELLNYVTDETDKEELADLRKFKTDTLALTEQFRRGKKKA